MKIIVQHSSMIPIYEQIVDQIKQMIVHHELTSGTALPSVRALSKELKISALTVKKAYDALEDEGFIQTVHGKGSFVKDVNEELVLEEVRKSIENELDIIIDKSLKKGISKDELKILFECLLEDY